MPNYTYATAGEALSAVAGRLYDRNMLQWTQDELLAYLKESLRTWNSLTNFWRADMSFGLSANEQWYDLHEQINTLVPYTVSQSEIIQQIEYHLLEPLTSAYPLSWLGSAQFSINDILGALQRRQDDTLGTAGCTITRRRVAAPITSRVTLPDSVIDIRRITWFPATSAYQNRIMRQTDRWAERAFSPRYTTKAQEPPTTWMQSTEPPPAFDVDTVPPIPGEYGVLSVDSGPQWLSTAGNTLTIPDDWTWVTKWGALMDLLSRESNAKDPLRTEYCRRRYAEGLAVLEKMPMVLALRLNNLPIAVDPFRSGDDYNPRWESVAAGSPTRAYLAANLLAFSPAASADDAFSATVTVCANAPVPSYDEYLQIPRDVYDVILDETQHLAMFKQGGDEFAQSLTLHSNFTKKAIQFNGKLQEMGFFELSQLDLSNAEEMRNPRYVPGSAPSL